jgi:hypothetical protein
MGPGRRRAFPRRTRPRQGPAHRPYSAAPACAGAALPSRSPANCTDVLAPRRLRVPDLNPSKRQVAEDGNLHLCYANSNRGDQYGNALGKHPGPRPRKPQPGSRLPPDPHSCLPRQTRPTARMTVESAWHRPRIPRRTCRARKCKGIGGTRPACRPGRSRNSPDTAEGRSRPGSAPAGT